MPTRPAIAGIWRGRTRRDVADHLDRDNEFVIALPDRVEILEILVDRQGLR